MPQITLEYSSNITEIDFQGVLSAIHEALSGITDINTCKSRVREARNFLIGKGEPQNAMVHLRIELLDRPERTPELRKNLSEKMVHILEQYFLPRIQALGLQCKPTVHIAKLKVYSISSGIFSKSDAEVNAGQTVSATKLQARL